MKLWRQHPYLTVILVTLGLIVVGQVFDLLTKPDTTPVMIVAADRYIEETRKDQPPLTFYQDGCTLFPDKILGHDFRSACFAHDIRYWAGGSEAERKAADRALATEIKTTGSLGPVFAPLMFVGVRMFGDSFVTKAVGAHWGYGWRDE
tara:strand:+ start:2309 stop:2752 length:444 start_codon:yes stop_codon:yes gene_type:complete